MIRQFFKQTKQPQEPQSFTLEIPSPVKGGFFNYVAEQANLPMRVIDQFDDRPRVVLQAESKYELAKQAAKLTVFFTDVVNYLREDSDKAQAFLVDTPPLTRRSAYDLTQSSTPIVATHYQRPYDDFVSAF